MSAEVPLVELHTPEGHPHAEAVRARVREVLAGLAPESTLREVEGAASLSVLVRGRALRWSEEDGPVPPRWLVEAAILGGLRLRGFLFLCVANSARSQLAEGIARSLAPTGVWVGSAGSEPTAVRPEAVQVLREQGLDLRGHRSKGVEEIPAERVEAVITLCAEEVCPAWLSAARRVHWGLPDPAAVRGQGRLDAFRRTRDELWRRLEWVFS